MTFKVERAAHRICRVKTDQWVKGIGFPDNQHIQPYTLNGHGGELVKHGAAIRVKDVRSASDQQLKQLCSTFDIAPKLGRQIYNQVLDALREEIEASSVEHFDIHKILAESEGQPTVRYVMHGHLPEYDLIWTTTHLPTKEGGHWFAVYNMGGLRGAAPITVADGYSLIHFPNLDVLCETEPVEPVHIFGRGLMSREAVERFISGETVSAHDIMQRMDILSEKRQWSNKPKHQLQTVYRLQSYFPEAFTEVTPYILYQSVSEGSGKTRGMELNAAFCFMAQHFTTPTYAAIYRSLNSLGSYLGLDEFELTEDRHPELFAILRAGYNPYAVVPIMVNRGDG